MDELKQMLQMSSESRVAIAAAVVWGLVALAKSDKVPIPVPPAYRLILAALLGQLFLVLQAVALGSPLGPAVLEGIAASALAVFGQEGLSKAGIDIGRPGSPGGGGGGPEDVSDPSKPPGASLRRVAVVVAALSLVGCNAAFDGAVKAQKFGAGAVAAAGRQLDDKCTEPLAEIAKVEPRDERLKQAAPLLEVCVPAREAYGAARAAHVLLTAALAAAPSGITVGELLELTEKMAKAAGEMVVRFKGLK